MIPPLFTATFIGQAAYHMAAKLNLVTWLLLPFRLNNTCIIAQLPQACKQEPYSHLCHPQKLIHAYSFQK